MDDEFNLLSDNSDIFTLKNVAKKIAKTDFVARIKSKNEEIKSKRHLYKIVNNISPTAEIIKIIKPIYNFKAGEGFKK